jgi:ribokinase
MFDVVSVGNATMDVFIEVEAKRKGNCILLPCGSKQEAKSIHYATGGGATNTAVAFSRLGLKTGILAAVGRDESGKAVVQELEKNGVDTSAIVKLHGFNTAYSAIITGRGFNRIILTYGGATTHLKKKSQVNWKKLGQSKWLFVSSFHSKPALLKEIFAFASRKGIRIAWNPGKSELKQGLRGLKQLLQKTSILFLNEEEAAILTGKKSVERNLKELQGIVPIVAITRGRKGSAAFDGNKLYIEGTHKVRVHDATGAGDAFNSGFLTALLWGRGIQEALRLGTRNAEATITATGAKNNLLSKKQAIKYV